MYNGKMRNKSKYDSQESKKQKYCIMYLNVLIDLFEEKNCTHSNRHERKN